MGHIRYLTLTLITLTILGCGASSDNTSNSADKLIGTWTYTYPNQCVETTTFSKDNTWLITALDSIQSGTYSFSEGDPGGKHTVELTVSEDNGLPDCAGESNTIPTGITLPVYVLFPLTTTLEIYFEKDHITPAYSLTKA